MTKKNPSRVRILMMPYQEDEGSDPVGYCGPATVLTGLPRWLDPGPAGRRRLANMPPGCAFAPRCPRAIPACESGRPALAEMGHERQVACIRLAETAA